ncbi:MAG: hypothetical protein DIU80_016580 [Chloroflexota bacterium]
MLGEHDSIVTSVSFSPDGNTVASGSLDETIRLWSIRCFRTECAKDS